MPDDTKPRPRSLLPPEPGTIGLCIAAAVLTLLIPVSYGVLQVSAAALDGWILRMLFERWRRGDL